MKWNKEGGVGAAMRKLSRPAQASQRTSERASVPGGGANGEKLAAGSSTEAGRHPGGREAGRQSRAAPLQALRQQRQAAGRSGWQAETTVMSEARKEAQVAAGWLACLLARLPACLAGCLAARLLAPPLSLPLSNLAPLDVAA